MASFRIGGSVEQGELGRDLTLQHVVVDGREGEAAGVAHDPGLGRDLGRDQDAAAGRVGGVKVDPLAVAGELLDVGGDGAHPLHLDDDGAAVRVAAEEVDRTDVGETLAGDHLQAGLDQLGRLLEQHVHLPLGAVALEHGVVGELDDRVVDDVLEHDHERLAGRGPVDADHVAVLGNRRRAGHVVQRLEAVIGVNAEAAVVLEQDHPVAGTEARGGAAVVGDLAAGDEEAHRRTGYRRRGTAGRLCSFSIVDATWERYAWAAGIVFVLALVAESVVAVGIGLTHQDSAGTIATGLHAHEGRMIVIACVSIVYAVAFVVYLWKLYGWLRGDPGRPNDLSTLVLVGGVLFVTLHATSDVGITGML